MDSIEGDDIHVPFYSAATFAIPSTDSVSETDSSAEVCVTMSTTTGDTLAKEVEVTLSTMDGSGNLVTLYVFE